MEIKKLILPLNEQDARGLRAGQPVLITGLIVAGRDRLHRYLFHERPRKEDLPFGLEGAVLYHAGLIEKGHDVISAGPTTSMRMEMYEPFIIEHYGIRGVMGKGGMGARTAEALKRSGCVYLQTVGGAAVYLADRIKSVRGSFFADEWGAAEAVMALEVEDFPAIVTMDANGGNVHAEIEKKSLEALKGSYTGEASSQA